ncbi:oligosaccharide flippase family protein [Sphingobacterium faecium]|uniref:oligosaccharide flippase family protein n=1 Tax=Sphingobacterium faecium TaxID=34087 RepID=UPI00247AF8F0|nr:oligosaccharide flippase family protein [Sphingobacterium faecium]WGQ12736.1 oligosaccharide flippase family protein [Sphingobacterium faecium]
MDKRVSYKKTLRSTVIFGGAQAVQMLITIVRAKIIAVLFGSHGMGINAIFQSTVSIINGFSSFGIFQSGVRDISREFENGDKTKLTIISFVFKRMVVLSALLGMLVCIVGAFWFSKMAFQNLDYSVHFLILSIGVFFNALSNGETVLLQGTRNLTGLAKASLIGALTSLLFSVPLFYYFGVLGIAIAITCSSLILFFSQFYCSRKIKVNKEIKVTFKESIDLATPILKLGTILMIGTVILTGFTYLTNIFIGRFGKIEDVGFFQGISSITTQSIAIIISILASDFFPRLSAVFFDREKVKDTVNQQCELVSIIITPITVILIVFAPIVVKLLLSTEFLIMVPMLRLLALSLLFKGIWLIMSYVILANGDKKSYLIYDSIIGNGLLFVCNILAYRFWGLEGLALSSFIASVTISIILTIVVKIKYKFFFNKGFLRILFVLILLVVLTFLNVSILSRWPQYCVSFFLLFLSLGYSLFILNKSVNFIDKVMIFLKPKI